MYTVLWQNTILHCYKTWSIVLLYRRKYRCTVPDWLAVSTWICIVYVYDVTQFPAAHLPSGTVFKALRWHVHVQHRQATWNSCGASNCDTVHCWSIAIRQHLNIPPSLKSYWRARFKGTHCFYQITTCRQFKILKFKVKSCGGVVF